MPGFNLKKRIEEIEKSKKKFKREYVNPIPKSIDRYLQGSWSNISKQLVTNNPHEIKKSINDLKRLNQVSKTTYDQTKHILEMQKKILMEQYDPFSKRLKNPRLPLNPKMSKLLEDKIDKKTDKKGAGKKKRQTKKKKKSKSKSK